MFITCERIILLIIRIPIRFLCAISPSRLRGLSRYARALLIFVYHPSYVTLISIKSYSASSLFLYFLSRSPSLPPSLPPSLYYVPLLLLFRFLILLTRAPPLVSRCPPPSSPPPSSAPTACMSQTKCSSDEVNITIVGVEGAMCSPVCGIMDGCPKDVPDAVTVVPPETLI